MPRMSLIARVSLTVIIVAGATQVGCQGQAPKPKSETVPARRLSKGGSGAATSCKDKGAQLIGGREDYTSHPATVALGIYNSENVLQQTCTGTFIRHDLVVTAAHCVTESGFGAIGQVAFDQDIKRLPEGGSAQTSLWAVHPNYKKSDNPVRDAKYDVAVVVFPSNSFRGAPVNITSQKLAPNQPVTLVGYGHTYVDLYDVSKSGGGDVRKVGNNRIDEIFEDTLFWSTQNRDMSGSDRDLAYVNHGDSGGPVLNQALELAGLMSVVSTYTDSATNQRMLASWATDATFVADFLNQELAKANPDGGGKTQDSTNQEPTNTTDDENDQSQPKSDQDKDDPKDSDDTKAEKKRSACDESV